MSTPIKDCPFCCSKIYKEDLKEIESLWCIVCPVCDSRGSTRSNPITAISYWNMRGNRK